MPCRASGSPCAIPGRAWTRSSVTGCSTPSIPPRRMGWAWGWRSAAGLSRRTAAGCGRRPMCPTVPSCSSRCRSGMRRGMMEAEALVFVVDDDASLRASLQDLLESVGLRVAACASAQDFLRRPRPEGPSCLVLDVRLPGLSGLELQQELARGAVQMPIIFITGHGDIPMSVQAMKAGAVDFLSKPFRDQDLLDAVHQAVAGDRLACAQRAERAALCRRLEALTPRQRDVMARMVAGLLTKQIAGELGTSEATVKTHRKQVMAKMRAESLADLIRIADQLSLLPPKS